MLLELLHCIKALLNAMLGAAQRLDQESCRLLSIMHHQVGIGGLLSMMHHEVCMRREGVMQAAQYHAPLGGYGEVGNDAG